MINTYPKALTATIKASTEVIGIQVNRYFMPRPLASLVIVSTRSLAQLLLIHFKSEIKLLIITVSRGFPTRSG